MGDEQLRRSSEGRSSNLIKLNFELSFKQIFRIVHFEKAFAIRLPRTSTLANIFIHDTAKLSIVSFHVMISINIARTRAKLFAITEITRNSRT